MYERLAELIAQGQTEKALTELEKDRALLMEVSGADKADFFVLEASLWESLGNGAAELVAIENGLSADPVNYELYYMLGLYYIHSNVNKGYLCFETALFYCSVQEDRKVISEALEKLKDNPALRIKNISFMILSYNDLDILKKCIASIEQTMPPQSYEIVVVDNASTQDGVIDYLRDCSKKAEYRFKLVENHENVGFPAGCNIGASFCNPENDILFFNNDAVLTHTAVFWMRMGLYDNRNVGACGALSNSASLQEIDFDSIRPYLDKKLLDSLNQDSIRWHRKAGFEKALSIFEKYSYETKKELVNPYIKTFRLTGFALLVSNEALPRIKMTEGKVFDETFSPGYFEDDDLGIRLALAGFDQYICKNALVYHNGGGGCFEHNDDMERSREKFRKKWGFDIWAYSLFQEDVCNEVCEYASKKEAPLRIADFDAGFGSNASYLKKHLKNAYISCICVNSFAAAIAEKIADEVIYTGFEKDFIPWKKNSFDIIICEKKDLNIAQRLLRDDGKIVLYNCP